MLRLGLSVILGCTQDGLGTCWTDRFCDRFSRQLAARLAPGEWDEVEELTQLHPPIVFATVRMVQSASTPTALISRTHGSDVPSNG